MLLPRLAHLRYLVVGELIRQSAPGPAIRDRLRADGIKQSGPAFYQVMAGLEDGDLVAGWYEQQIVDGQIIRERHCKVLAAGPKAVAESRRFNRAGATTRPGFAGG